MHAANKIINQKQLVLSQHTDGIKVSCVNTKVSGKSVDRCELTCGSEELVSIKEKQGKVREFLVMNLKYSEKDKLKAFMKGCGK